MNRPIGLLGGTFDPVHHGHLRIAVEALERLQLESVRLIPLHAPPHRRQPHAAAAQRLRMLQAAVAGNARLIADDLELQRGGVSYTFDTLSDFRRRYPGTPLCLILGYDAFASLPAWHRWDELFALAHIAVVARPGVPAELQQPLPGILRERQVTTPANIAAQPAGGIYLLDCPQLDISGSAIRALLAAGRSPRYLLPDPVADVIAAQQLYLD